MPSCHWETRASLDYTVSLCLSKQMQQTGLGYTSEDQHVQHANSLPFPYQPPNTESLRNTNWHNTPSSLQRGCVAQQAQQGLNFSTLEWFPHPPMGHMVTYRLKSHKQLSHLHCLGPLPCEPTSHPSKESVPLTTVFVLFLTHYVALVGSELNAPLKGAFLLPTLC